MIDIAYEVTAHAVRLDDGKGTLDWHDDLGWKIKEIRPWGADKEREVYWSGRGQAIRMTSEVPVLLGKTLFVLPLTAAEGSQRAATARPRFQCSRSEHLRGGVAATPLKGGAQRLKH
jgi:hypothetical protein